MRERPDKTGEKGTVLLTTLLITALIATVAIGVMNDLKYAIKRTVNVNAYSQVDWYARGAEDYARLFLGEIFTLLPTVAQNAALYEREPILLPLDQGAIVLTVHDGSHCFAINSLIKPDGSAHEPARQQLNNLLQVLGYGTADSQRLTDTITDWIDKDSQPRNLGAEDGTYLGLDPAYRTANTALSSVQELRAIQGVDEALYQELRPYLCAGAVGVPSVFNINSARVEHAAHLAAILGGPDQITTALRLIEDAPPNGYADAEAIKSSPHIGQDWPESLVSLDLFKFQPETLWMEVEITHGPAYRARSFAFDNKGETLTYRGWGRESFRPKLPGSGDEKTEAADTEDNGQTRTP